MPLLWGKWTLFPPVLLNYFYDWNISRPAYRDTRKIIWRLWNCDIQDTQHESRVSQPNPDLSLSSSLPSAYQGFQCRQVPFSMSDCQHADVSDLNILSYIRFNRITLCQPNVFLLLPFYIPNSLLWVHDRTRFLSVSPRAHEVSSYTYAKLGVSSPEGASWAIGVASSVCVSSCTRICSLIRRYASSSVCVPSPVGCTVYLHPSCNLFNSPYFFSSSTFPRPHFTFLFSCSKSN